MAWAPIRTPAACRSHKAVDPRAPCHPDIRRCPRRTVIRDETGRHLGGGPAGAFAAERLASAGLDAVVFDEKLAWEKPCGGGLTYKAYNTYPFLIENDTPKKLVAEMVLAAPRAKSAT